MTFLKFHTVTSESSQGSIFTSTFPITSPAKSFLFPSLPYQLVIVGPGSGELLRVCFGVNRDVWLQGLWEE